MPVKFPLPWGSACMHLRSGMERERWLISKHDQLRELCVLAAAGDVAPSESGRVHLHLDKCESCRALFAELRDIHAIQLAHVPSLAIRREAEEESRLKDSILRAARGESVRFPEPLGAQVIQYEKPETKLVQSIQGIRGWSIGAPVCLLGACLALAFAFALRPRSALDGHRSAGTPQIATTSVPPGPAVPIQETPNRDEAILRRRVASLEAERSRLEHFLQERQSENAKLQNGDAEKQQQLAALSKELESARAGEAKASQRFEQLDAEHQMDQTAIAAQNGEIRFLSEKLEDQRASQERTRDLIEAERDLHELVGARNLHIVDVYDTDSRGKTQKAVGRVFYIEGKSLVFYAYDVSKGRSDTSKYAYYVWGNKDGNLETVRNLGILDTDDPLKKTWKLHVSDATVLADIDRVFVTVETVGKLGPRPRGKQILNAYLGGPVNHP